MKDDEKDIRFRDECAMRFMEALLARKESATMLNTIIENYHKPEYQNDIDYYYSKAERLAHISYKLADIMRKARLASFK